jgi:hypothetical protein
MDINSLSNPMLMFYFILLVHLLYDFHWQGPFIAENKGKNIFILFVHSITWALLIGAILLLGGIFFWWKLIFLLFTHMIIDKWNCNLVLENRANWASSYYDQAFHLITIIIVLLPFN